MNTYISHISHLTFHIRHVLVLLSAIVLLVSCDKTQESVAPTVSNEALTTIQLKLVNDANAADSLTATIKVDAVTGEITDTSKAFLHLKTNAVYSSRVVLLDTTKSPVLDVSAEIKERANYHLFFYQPSPMEDSKLITGATSPYIPGTITSTSGPYLNLSIQRTDEDTNNPPLQVGLTASFTAGNASTGRLNLVLRHQPNAKNGLYGPGSTDLDVNFSVEIY